MIHDSKAVQFSDFSGHFALLIHTTLEELRVPVLSTFHDPTYDVSICHIYHKLSDNNVRTEFMIYSIIPSSCSNSSSAAIGCILFTIPRSLSDFFIDASKCTSSRNRK